MELAALVDAWRRLRETRGRRAKVGLLTEALRRLPPEEAATGACWLAGVLPDGRPGVGPAALARARAVPAAPAPRLTVAAVAEALRALGAGEGAGAGARRAARLQALFAEASAPEQRFLAALLAGELRQGASEGLLVEALAEVARVPTDAVRRALQVSGSLAETARAALGAGGAGLARLRLELFRPVRPMLAASAQDPEEALAALGGAAAFEAKLDGARIQVHTDGDTVRVFSRRGRDMTDAVPEVVALARGLGAPLVLDGEVLALRSDGRPHAFQTTMRRVGRRREAEALRERLPLAPFFFDCLWADGEDLTARPTAERIAALEARVPAARRVPRCVTDEADVARAFGARVLAAGHEGMLAKALDAPYEAGARGAAWRKLKPVTTFDLVVLAAEWGSGRRRGWLSNLHLGARDAIGGGLVMVGKTFKGLTDAMLRAQTGALLAREVAREGAVVHVRPELVVEVAVDGVQRSPHYPGGLALRFARVRRYRDDKTAAEADTLDALRRLLVGADAADAG